MKTAITETGKNRDGIPTAVIDVSFEVVVEAEGHRREDGLTAAQVREEIRRRKQVTDVS